MPWVSRRNLISAGIAASATALLPDRLFSFSGKLENAVLLSASVSAGGQVEQVGSSAYSVGQQVKILDLEAVS